MKNSKNKGFTLIELLVVVLIIGILAAIALPQYTKSVNRSRGAEAMINMAAIKGAAERYYLANRSYSGISMSELDLDFGTTAVHAFGYMGSNGFGYYVGSHSNNIASMGVSYGKGVDYDMYLDIQFDNTGKYTSVLCEEGKDICKAMFNGTQLGSTMTFSGH